jgi:hypothetical protein
MTATIETITSITFNGIVYSVNKLSGFTFAQRYVVVLRDEATEEVLGDYGFDHDMRAYDFIITHAGIDTQTIDQWERGKRAHLVTHWGFMPINGYNHATGWVFVKGRSFMVAGNERIVLF